MKIVYALVVSVLIGLAGLLMSCYASDAASIVGSEAGAPQQEDTLFFQKRLKASADLMAAFIKKSVKTKYNTELVFLVDMKIPSQHYRFFVYNLKTNTILSEGLMAHGSGSETEVQDSLQFSNTPNSYMTSLGKYRIGKSYAGQFGKAYKLHGLDATNNKALERTVVLHRYGCVPETEKQSPICNSLGCPMLSELFFLKVDSYITASKLPVLLYIFD
jgi:hypothetical protein